MGKKIKQPNKLLRCERELRGWSQQKLADYLQTTEQVVNRWENGEHKPNRHHQTLLCQLFGKSAGELGFIDMPHQTQKEDRNIEQGEIDLDKLRRILVQGALELAAGGLLPQYTSLLASYPYVTALDEETVSRANTTITYCWQLYFAGEHLLLEQFLPAFLAPLLPLVEQSSRHQKTLASIISRSYQLIWLLNLQQQNFGQALVATRQSFVYAQLAQDSNLLLASLVREAHTYFHLNNPVQQVSIHEKAVQYVPGASPLLQGWFYLVMAESQAHLIHKKEADYFLGLTKDTFPEQPEHDPNHSYVPINNIWLANYEIMTHLHLKHPKAALNTLNQFEKANPGHPLGVEFLNRRVATFYMLGDLQATCDAFEIAAPAAKQSGSSLRYNEVCNIYRDMLSSWPHETRVKKLGDLLRK
ncbi:MAG TPA: helix-turn-helix transcriptional regulator [Ktedonobacteraceae bacterium]|jgi:transcriptional regulator with XRE-family HTH domain|nr:helix-turn-helix transcriptional regulator [Ktedonobacteraceae bacterium]